MSSDLIIYSTYIMNLVTEFKPVGILFVVEMEDKCLQIPGELGVLLGLGN